MIISVEYGIESGIENTALVDPGELSIVSAVYFYVNTPFLCLSNQVRRAGTGLLFQNFYITEKS